MFTSSLHSKSYVTFGVLQTVIFMVAKNVQGVKAESGKCLSSKLEEAIAGTETNDASAESPGFQL